MNSRILYWWIVLFLGSTFLNGQETQLLRLYETQDRYQDFFFSQSLYGLSALEKESNNLDQWIDKGYYPRLNIKSQQYKLISNLRMHLNGSLDQLKSFVSSNIQHPELNPAHMELGIYYYNKKAYQLGVQAFDRVNTSSLNDLELSSYSFRKGYCHFVQKEFAQAARLFDSTKDLRNIYYYPNNYYSGMCSYFEGDFGTAITSFEKVNTSTIYRSMIPYYITQIYFAQGEYDRLLNYGEKAIRQSDTKNLKEIRLLIGQSYFKKNQFERSLPHLEYYEENTPELTKEEFYQLAFTQYQLGYYPKAIDNFLELTLLDDKMGQVASYYLADCYQRLGDQNSARTAYKKVSQMNFEESMQKEAQFNYGKLSAELNYDREAINTLIQIPNTSLYYRETQDIMNDLLSTTNDFDNAIDIIESLGDNLTDKLKATYQSITYKNGLKAYSEGKIEKARLNFPKVMTYPKDKSMLAQSHFWMAQMLSDEGNYIQSIQAFDQYFEMTNGSLVLPQESSPFIANYSQAYNYLKLEDYNLAGYQFKNSIVGININRDRINNTTILERILPDAFIRAGDCYFKLKDYNEAKIHYDQSIDRKQAGFVYALYQRGLIEGLQGQPYEKILTMENLSTNFAKNAYADDALMQLGDVYLSLGQSIKAKEAFQKVYIDYSDREEWRNNALLKLGLVSYNQGDIQAALGHYKNIFNNNPSPTESQEAILAIEEIYVEDLSQTEEYFEFLATIPGYEVDAFTKDSLNYKVGLKQYEQAQYEEAIDGFTKYLNKYESGYYRNNVRYYRGESYASLKQYSKALKDYESVISDGFNPFYTRSLRKAGIIAFNHTRSFSKAYKYYDDLAGRNENEDITYEAQLGALRSAYKMNSYSKVGKYRSAIQSNPLSTASDKNSSNFFLAKTAQSSGNDAEAISAYRLVSKSTSNVEGAESRYRIAELLYKRGNMNEAEAQCNETNEKSGGYPFWIAKSLLLMTDIYLTRDDVFNARAAVEAVIENFKDNGDIIDEAEQKIALVESKEEALNRIKSQPIDGNLELDTTGGK